MNNHYAKFQYKGMEIVGVTDYPNQTTSEHFMKIKSKFKIPKMTKISLNVYKILGTHLQCVNNHYAKFQYKRMKTVGVTDHTNQTPPADFG